MVCSNSCLHEAKCAVCVLQVIMCRHKGIGMNKPQKSKVEAAVTLKVRLLLRGNVAENLPDEIPAPTFSVSLLIPLRPPRPSRIFCRRTRIMPCRTRRRTSVLGSAHNHKCLGCSTSASGHRFLEWERCQGHVQGSGCANGRRRGPPCVRRRMNCGQSKMISRMICMP